MKALIITLYGNNNYGNKLQNYATQKILERFGISVSSLRIEEKGLKKNIKKYLRKIKVKKVEKKRLSNFIKFNKNIKYTDYVVDFNEDKIKEKYDFYIVGSDQVWNPYMEGLSKVFLLKNIERDKKISFAASFGVEKLPDSYPEFAKESIKNFKCLSVREDKGKEIIENMTDRKDIEVLVDPTMLLARESWDKISNKPSMLNLDKKYILNYFLGEISNNRRKEIERIAKENDCQIINILDKNSEFYECGPSEFLYLERNAFLICTDSFHSCVFAILYDRPFIIFDREQKNMVSMNSRIDTLISKFKLKNRKYNGQKITEENLKHDYTEAYKILEEERKKTMIFLENALSLGDNKRDE